MKDSFGTLGSLDAFFSAKKIHCKTPGCKKVFEEYTDATLNSLMHGKDHKTPKNYLCQLCADKIKTLLDENIKCSSDKCENTWLWTKDEQLISSVKGFNSPPKKFCKDCKDKINSIEDKEVKCKIKGCEKTWIWDRKTQIESSVTPTKMCDTCFNEIRKLQDKSFQCRVPNCLNTWSYNRFQQREDGILGKYTENSPKRMCKKCFALFRKFKPLELICKVKECNNSYLFSPFEQLEHYLKNPSEKDNESTVPEKMCKSCFNYIRTSEARKIRCKIKGCTNTWNYTKSMQLHDKIKKRYQAHPKRMCDTCYKELNLLKSKQIACKYQGCTNTYSCSPEEQLEAICKKITLPQKGCKECEEFLLNTRTESDKKCKKCENIIKVSPFEQLMALRGHFTVSDVCSDCTSKKLDEQGKKNSYNIISHINLVQIPAIGSWNNDHLISERPEYITQNKIKEVETSDIRIVVFGDDISFSAKKEEETWPYLLERFLEEKIKKNVVVINSSIPRVGSIHALKRLIRDVTPYNPDFIIYSFAFADSLLRNELENTTFKPCYDTKKTLASIDKLSKKLSEINSKLLYWTTNPILPRVYPLLKFDKDSLILWQTQQLEHKERMLAHSIHAAKKQGIPILDIRSRFEVNGEISAKKWMKDWFNHNSLGAEYISGWIGDYILGEM